MTHEQAPARIWAYRDANYQRRWKEANYIGATEYVRADIIAGLVTALERCAALTPAAANAQTARDLHLTVAAIANTALTSTKEPSHD